MGAGLAYALGTAVGISSVFGDVDDLNNIYSIFGAGARVVHHTAFAGAHTCMALKCLKTSAQLSATLPDAIKNSINTNLIRNQIRASRLVAFGFSILGNKKSNICRRGTLTASHI